MRGGRLLCKLSVRRETSSINTGIKQASLISPWQFNLHMDGVMGYVKAGVLEMEVITFWEINSFVW